MARRSRTVAFGEKEIPEGCGPTLGTLEVSREQNSCSIIGASDEGGVSWVRSQMAETEKILEGERLEAWREDPFP